MVRPAWVIDVVPQATEVKDAQEPLYNCNCGLVIFAPKLLIVIVSVVLTATNENQTS